MKERNATETDEEKLERQVRKMFPDYARDYADIASVFEETYLFFGKINFFFLRNLF